MTPEMHVRLILAAGAAAAHQSPVLEPEAPCSRCHTPSPAAEAGECDHPDCPLEGR